MGEAEEAVLGVAKGEGAEGDFEVFVAADCGDGVFVCCHYDVGVVTEDSVFVDGDVARAGGIVGGDGSEGALLLEIFLEGVDTGDAPRVGVGVFEWVAGFAHDPRDEICAPGFGLAVGVFGAGAGVFEFLLGDGEDALAGGG